MSKKVKLPKAVCDALEDVRNHMFNYSHSAVVAKTLNKSWERHELKVLNGQNADKIMRALVLGYEPEQTPEEQLKERYENRGDYCTYEHFLGYRDGVKDALHLHGIKYDWIKGWGEEDAE